MIRGILYSVLFLLSKVVFADSPIVLKADRLLDVVTGKMHYSAKVVVEGERITAVNPQEVPAGAEVIDLGNVTLLPGFMDMHVHLGMNQDWVGKRITMVTESASENALRSARNAEKILMAGFTTIREIGQVHPSEELIEVSVMHGVENGWIVGPRIVPAGHIISITGGHADPVMFGPFAEGILDLGVKHGIADGVDEVVKAVRHQIRHGAKVIKITATAGVMSLEAQVGAQQFTDEEMRAIVEEAARHNVKVAAHAHGTQGIIAAVKAGVASIEHGSVLNEEAIRLMKRNGTYLVPTVYLTDVMPYDQLPPLVRKKAGTILPLMQNSLRRAIKAGVKIALGTDTPVFPHGDNGREFGAMVARGMSHINAIRAGTINGADLLGVEDRGTIDPGKLADIVAVPGNPLDDIDVLTDVRFVMKGGKIYKQ